MLAFAQALFAATGAMGLLLQILGNLVFDNGMLHRFKQILGFSQSQPQLCGLQGSTIPTSYVFNGFGVSTVGFDNDLHLDFHWPPPAGYAQANTFSPRA
jgi:hypothetical protein